MPEPVYATAVTLTATVAPASGTMVPTQGSVTFFVNGTTLLGAGTFAGSDANHDALFTYVTAASQLQVASGAAQPIVATVVGEAWKDCPWSVDLEISIARLVKLLLAPNSSHAT